MRPLLPRDAVTGNTSPSTGVVEERSHDSRAPDASSSRSPTDSRRHHPISLDHYEDRGDAGYNERLAVGHVKRIIGRWKGLTERRNL